MKHKISILKIVVRLLALGAAAGLGAVGVLFLQRKRLTKRVQNGDVYKAYYRTLYEWVEKKSRGKSIADFFKENNYKSIAIYGMGTLGELLYNELKNTEVEVSFWIEKDADAWENGIGDLPVVGINGINNQQKIDVIVVTPISHFNEICETLEGTCADIECISLKDVVHGI